MLPENKKVAKVSRAFSQMIAVVQNEGNIISRRQKKIFIMFLGECVDNTVLGHIFIEDDLAGNT